MATHAYFSVYLAPVRQHYKLPLNATLLVMTSTDGRKALYLISKAVATQKQSTLAKKMSLLFGMQFVLALLLRMLFTTMLAYRITTTQALLKMVAAHTL